MYKLKKTLVLANAICLFVISAGCIITRYVDPIFAGIWFALYGISELLHWIQEWK